MYTPIVVLCCASCCYRLSDRSLISVLFRVFLDGDYTEPPLHLLPPTPMVEEINDCKCIIM